MSTVKIGVIGFSDMSNQNIRSPETYPATVVYMIRCMQNLVRQKYGTDVVFEMVGGLTNMGVNKYTYDQATRMKDDVVKTVGFACSKASEFPNLLSVDEKHIVGIEPGDESEAFVDFIDTLLKIGGGDKEAKEWDMFTTKYPDKLCYDASYLL